MMDSAKNYCYSVVGQLKEKLFHALHDGGSASINLAMHYYKRQTHPYIEQNCLNGKSLDKIRFIADTAKEGNFSPLIKLIRHLIEERLGDSDAAIEVNAYLERVKDAATGCLLIHSHQLPTAPIGLGEALTQKIAIVCVNHQLYLVEKELNNEQKVSPLLDDPTNLIKHQAYIRAKKFFEGMRLGKSKLAEVHELKALNDAFDLNIISALECVIRDYIPAFRKLKVSQYVKDKLNESDVVRNGELMLFSQNQTDSHHLSQIKKIINALFLIQRGLERCERLPVNFGNLDDVNYQLSTIAALGPLVDDLYNGYQLLSHPDFEISIFKEMFSFLIPMANHIGGMLPVLSDLVPELSESDHIHLAKKIGYIAGFSINQLHPHELHGQFDYAFLTGFGAHIPGYLSDLSALMTASAPDLGNEKAIDLKIKALEKNGMQLLNGLDALQKGDFLASINILNYIHILRNSYDLIQAILKEFEHLSESSKVKILSLIRALKYDCIAPLSGIFDKIQAENLLSSTEISANFGDMIGPWYEQLIHVASNVVDFSKEQDLLTLDEPRFVETRLKTAYEQQLNDQKKIILFDLNIVTLETFMTDLRTIQGVGLFDDHEKKKRLIANYRLLQPYAEKLRPRLSNDIVKHLNGAKCVSTGLLRDIETLKMHLLGHFSQMKSTINFHTQLVEDCIDAVNQGVDDSCGIVRMEVDPTTLSFKIIFEQLHSSKKVKNLIILFDGKLYFADRKKHEVSEIKKPESSDDLELHLINQIYNYEKLKALNFSAELTVAKPETLALISTVTGRYFRQVSMTPWPIYQNVFRMDVSAEAPIEQEKALFVELKKLARAKKAYTLFLNEIRTFDGLISFGMLDYDKKEALRKQYALFQPVLVSALRLVPGIHKLDTQLIHALSGKVQTYKEPLNIQALRDVFDEVVRCIDEKAIDIDHQLGVLKNRTAPVVVQSNHLLVENKALEKREPYLVKNTEPFIKITEQLTLALDNLFDNIDPKIRTRFLAQKMNGVPYPELENERQLEAQPVQILMYKQFKNALYYIKEANQKIIKLKDTDKVTDANETLVWTAVNLGFGIKQHKTEVLIDVAAVSSDIYSAYALISAVSKDALIPEVSHIQTLFNNACKRVQQGLIQPVYLDQAWGLIKSPIDPKTVKFQDLDKSFKYESAVILYNGKLYYTDRADKKVKQLIETESNKEACEQIEQLCQDEFKLADSHELSLIVSAIGKPLQKEDDALLLGLNALMSGPDHFKGEPTAEALALAKKQAKKASVDIWRMTLDSSQSWFKLLQEIPTCTALIKHLKNKIKLFAKEGNKATKENLEQLRNDYFIPLLILADAYEEKYCLKEGLLTKPLNDRFEAFYKEFIGRLGLPASEHLKILLSTTPLEKRIAATKQRLHEHSKLLPSYPLAHYRSKQKKIALGLAQVLKQNSKKDITVEYIESVLLKNQEYSQGGDKGFVHIKSLYDTALRSHVDENKKELIEKALSSTDDLDVSINALYEKIATEFYLKNKEMYQQLESVTSAYFRLEQYVQNAQKGFFLSQIENEKTLANKKQLLAKLKLVLFDKSTLALEKLKMVHNIVYEDTNFKETILEQANNDWWSFSNLFQVLVLLFEACAYVVSLGLYSYKSEREQCYQAFNQSFFKQPNNQFETNDACTKLSTHLKSAI